MEVGSLLSFLETLTLGNEVSGWHSNGGHYILPPCLTISSYGKLFGFHSDSMSFLPVLGARVTKLLQEATYSLTPSLYSG